MRQNPTIPKKATIVGIVDESPFIKTFTLKFLEKRAQEKFFFTPGKFMIASIFGFGEMPISISSSPLKTDSLDLTVARVGNISSAMHRLNKGDIVGLRGPFGKPYPISKFRGKNVVVVAGGCGFASLRSLVLALHGKREKFKKIFVFFGCGSPVELIFRKELKEWEQEKNFSVVVTVDNPDAEWRGCTGVVTKAFHTVDVPSQNSVVAMCGPPLMIHFSVLELKKMGFTSNQIYASLERLMHCGVGKCAHCNIAGKYVCIDGPIFNGSEIEKMPLKED
jgi:sulfhydrogenase subunit gamma (sulfur reductase)